MEFRRIIQILLRRWWLIVGLPLVVLVGLLVRSANDPYVATLRATVLIPGDTEVPGSAERPELMVMDDVPALIDSRVFAEAVAAQLPAVAPGITLSVDEIGDALTAERYSRVVTIRSSRAEAREAEAIAEAAAAVLPEAVNQFLVAAGTLPATVQVIDPPGAATRESARLIIAVETFVALAVGIGLAVLAAMIDQRLHSTEEIEEALGLPVLGDVRATGGPMRWLRLRA